MSTEKNTPKLGTETLKCFESPQDSYPYFLPFSKVGFKNLKGAAVS